MILLIDNYDSFTGNLYQMLGEMEPDIRVIRNDELSVREILDMHPAAIILSPGPGSPDQAGIIEELVAADEDIPLLGICLGHQAICEVFGYSIIHAPRLMHGKKSTIRFEEDHFLFRKCQAPLEVARYHSLVADPAQESAELRVLAESEDGQIMAVEHVSRPIFGLQFHPESILTPQGGQILASFLQEVAR